MGVHRGSRRTRCTFARVDIVIHQRWPDSRKLPVEFADAELLTKVLGPSTALSCEWLTTTYDDLHAIALLSHADLSEHSLTSDAALVAAGADLAPAVLERLLKARHMNCRLVPGYFPARPRRTRHTRRRDHQAFGETWR